MGINSFDIVRDSWIPVKTLKDESLTVSLLDLFENAHIYKFINENNMFYSYGIYNFLIAFFASAYYLKTIEDKESVLEVGSFDIVVIKKYIEKCEQDRPNCFNLFGDNPFYQNKWIKTKVSKDKQSMIGKIALHLPSGNNSYFFTNDNLVGSGLNCIECVKALLSYGLFQAGQDGPNSASGVNGAMSYPLYFLINGHNLFDIIVLNTIVEETWKSYINYDYIGNAAWEIEPEKESKKIVKNVTMIEGLSFQNRQVLLGDFNLDDKVYSVYFGPGRSFDVENNKEGKFWRQFNAAYFHKKDKKTGEYVSEMYPLVMRNQTDFWTNLGDLFQIYNEDSLISTVREYMYIIEDSNILQDKGYSEKYIDYFIYYTLMEGGKHPLKNQGIYMNYVPIVLLKNNDFLTVYNDLIHKADLIGKNMRFSLLDNSIDIKKYSTKYYNFVDSILIPDFLRFLLNLSDVTSFYDYCEEFKKKLRDIALSVYKEAYLNLNINKVTRDKSENYYGKYGNMVKDLNKYKLIVETILQ